MQNRSKADARRSVLLSFIVLGLLSALIIVPYQFRSKASGDDSAKSGLMNRTESHVPGLENYDVRTGTSKEASEALFSFREESSKSASEIADVREDFVRGEESLRTSVESLKIDYSPLMRAPEVISPDVYKANVEHLTGPSRGNNAETLKDFAKDYNQLFGMDQNQIDQLKVIADYTNPSGSMSFVNMTQEINGVPVFAGNLSAGFTTRGEMVRIINNLAPGLDYGSLSVDFGNPASAVRAAAGHINYKLQSIDVTPNEVASTDLKTVFGEGDWATTAERMYFPTEIGVARPAWRVLIWQPVNAFYVIVDAETGTMLWRKNITEDQTSSATYSIYGNPNAYINAADSPAPLSPGPVNPTTGTQGVIIPRTSRTLIGNEAPNWGMNDLGWMTDGTNVTDGNFVEAGIDRDGTNGVDAPQPGDGTCPGAGCRSFTAPTWNPPPGNPGPGDDPLTPQAQRGAVIQMFYVMNLYHDVLYNLGWTEPAFNFQNNNLGRGGSAADRVSAEGQDSSGTNNANMSTPADGGRGRMQMFLWTGPTPDYDGTADADVIIHEVSHGLSNRLHNNTAGLTANMSRGMGEGWGDWYANTLLAEPTDPINGVYSLGGYATFLAATGFTSNYYHGIRKFPKAPIAFTGGPNNLPHNPLTFKHLNVGCATEIGTTTTAVISAYPRGPFGVAQCDQVHNAGEIWSSALWEVRNLMVTRLGFTPGSKRAMQVVTDGMKLAPLNPTFLQERDAIIAAAAALPVAPNAGADVVDVREGFRRRGMGFSASVQVASPAAVTEAFDTPNVVMTNPFSVSDSTGNNNGFPEPGENIVLNVAVANQTGATVNSVTVNVNGGANVSYGNVADGATVSMPIPFTVPGAAACGSTQNVTINIASALGAQTPQMRSFVLGAPVGIVENFDGVVVPALPAGWTTTQDVGTTINWVTTATGPSSAPNSAFANDPASVNMSSLVSPTVNISSASAQLKFKNKYVTEASFDGMVLEMKVGAGAFQDIIAAGGTFVSGGYNATISSTFMSPIAGRMAWAGTSAGGYIDTVVNLPASANGQVVQFRWRMATDVSVSATGVNVDDVQIISSFNCVASGNSRADFDGDGKTDLSVFRPSDGNWYVNGSTAGFSATHFGLSTDTPVPADYDGDGKADKAIFRASNTPGTPDFFILKSSTMTLQGAEWGSTGDIPLAADYSGDGKADLAVFRPSNGTWYVLDQTNGDNGIAPFGQSGDIPMVMDNDGDGRANLAVFRPGNNTWYIAKPTGTPAQNFNAYIFGTAGDKLVPADYDGDGKDDVAVFRPSNGTWYILNSMGGLVSYVPFGISTDVPVPGDYDGDGKDDVAVYRMGTWHIKGSTSGVSQSTFGLGTDTSVPSKYIP